MLDHAGVIDELAYVQLGDRRLDRRAQKILGHMTRAADESLPSQFAAAQRELDAAYDFFSNPRIAFADLLKPHQQATVQRCRGLDKVRVAIDTTTLTFTGAREQLPYVNRKARGFFAHVALATDAQRVPLGVLHATTFKRDQPPVPRAKGVKPSKARRDPQQTERARWAESIRDVAEQLRPVAASGVKVVVVADREIDEWDTLEAAVLAAREQGMNFVFRGNYDRLLQPKLKPDGTPWLVAARCVSEAVAWSPTRVKRYVELPVRAATGLPSRDQSHPPRAVERLAELELGVTTVELRRPPKLKSGASSLSLQVVWVREVDPPTGEEPVSWWLLTNLPCDTSTQIEAVVDEYRGRWPIEEFFKALKTGCQIESRQLETYEALSRMLALSLILAWSLLRVTKLAREAPTMKAETVLGPEVVAAARVMAHEGYRMSAEPTLLEIVLEIARLGGHLPRNGAPGWQTLYKGWRRIQDALTLIHAVQNKKLAQTFGTMSPIL